MSCPKIELFHRTWFRTIKLGNTRKDYSGYMLAITSKQGRLNEFFNDEIKCGIGCLRNSRGLMFRPCLDKDRFPVVSLQILKLAARKLLGNMFLLLLNHVEILLRCQQKLLQITKYISR